MGILIDLTGQRFGNWTVIEKTKNPSEYGSAVWLCRCDCGNTGFVRGKDLRHGKSKSCGCSKKKHGGEGSRLYFVWHDMKDRCFNPSSPAFADYGGRGITVCNEWRDDFNAFRAWALANGYDVLAPRGQCTIDRINNDGPYSPENCRWATTRTQSNNRRSNHMITYKGDTRTLTEWAERTGIHWTVLRNRINVLGWTIEDALETPVKNYSPRKG